MKRSFISKSDMAQAYFPYIDIRSARHKLMSLINDDSELLTQLKQAGYKTLSHQFSPVQVDIITTRLGNPWT